MKITAGKTNQKEVPVILVTPEGEPEAALRKAMSLPASPAAAIPVNKRLTVEAGDPPLRTLRPPEPRGRGEEREVYRLAGAEVASMIRELDIERVQLGVGALPDQLEERIADVAEGLLLGSYQFCRYLDSGRQARNPTRAWIDGALPRGTVARVLEPVERLASGVMLSRDLTNTPALDLGPQELEEAARDLARRHRLKFDCLREEALRRKGMGGILSVGMGSPRRPRLIQVSTRSGSGTLHAVLVGKGVCFDSGGLSLKPPKAMELMKKDMAGAAITLGVMEAVAQNDLPLRVTVVIPAVENMPDGHAIRPGDVIRAGSGKTVEVLNTDAEGRLILMDALHHAAQLKPDVMVDIATLTGQAGATFGNVMSPIFSNRDDLAELLVQVGYETYERVWPMPLVREYREAMAGDISDLKNVSMSGTYPASSILAACFLWEFVGDTPWIHVDIANQTHTPGDAGYRRKGATGTGVRLLYRFLEQFAARSMPAKRPRGRSRKA